MEIYTLYIDYISWCVQRLPDTGILIWAPKICAQIKEKLVQNNIHYLIVLLMSMCLQLRHLSISLKIIELKRLCMPVSASLFKCITEYCFCINKSSL